MSKSHYKYKDQIPKVQAIKRNIDNSNSIKSTDTYKVKYKTSLF